MPGDVTREQVILAYRMMLGREPENEDVVERGAASWPDLASLGKAFAGSPEFARRHGINTHALAPLDALPDEVQLDAAPAELTRMMAHLAAYWTGIGESAPHWSVLTEERFLPENIGAHLAAFYEGGAWEARILDATLARIGRRPDEFRHCVDYGCGVGRLAVHFARRFPQVTGLDISAPHLRLADAALRETGAAGWTLGRITAEELMPVPSCDLWYSRIVLQHDPPPIAMEVLRLAFASLAPKGVAMFQIPTWIEGYRFRIADYLAAEPCARMETHAVPQRAILELAHRQGMILREVRDDSHLIGMPGAGMSNTFVFEKI